MTDCKYNNGKVARGKLVEMGPELPRRTRRQVALKLWHMYAKLHGVASQKTVILTLLYDLTTFA
jgi:hypothetical protein